MDKSRKQATEVASKTSSKAKDAVVMKAKQPTGTGTQASSSCSIRGRVNEMAGSSSLQAQQSKNLNKGATTGSLKGVAAGPPSGCSSGSFRKKSVPPNSKEVQIKSTISATAKNKVTSSIATPSGSMGPPPMQAQVGRKSLPVQSKGLQIKQRLRRMSEKFLPIKEEKTAESESPLNRVADDEGSDSDVTVIMNKQVEDGVLCIANQTEIDMISLSEEDMVTHLIYGEGYTGAENSAGLPNDLVFAIAKTPDLEILELRGFWNFTNIPNDFIGFLAHFPKLSNLRKLVLPKYGRGLDRMGSILMGLFGEQLKRLETSLELLTLTCADSLSRLLPNLKHLKIFQTTEDVLKALLEIKSGWNLDVLELGELRDPLVPGIPVDLLTAILTRFGPKLVQFICLFPVTDENGEVMDRVEVQRMIETFIPPAEPSEKSSSVNKITDSSPGYVCKAYRFAVFL